MDESIIPTKLKNAWKIIVQKVTEFSKKKNQTRSSNKISRFKCSQKILEVFGTTASFGYNLYKVNLTRQ